jgi:hypothetical protein
MFTLLSLITLSRRNQKLLAATQSNIGFTKSALKHKPKLKERVYKCKAKFNSMILFLSLKSKDLGKFLSKKISKMRSLMMMLMKLKKSSSRSKLRTNTKLKSSRLRACIQISHLPLKHKSFDFVDL